MTDLLPLLMIAAAAGAIGGVLAGLLGVGGGIVIVPALYIALNAAGVDPALSIQMAVGTSLATIVFTSLSSASGHARKGAIDWALLKLWGPSILVGVLLGGLLGGLVSGALMLAVFAVVAMVVALDLMLRNPAERQNPRSFAKPVWAALGVMAGALSALMGIGGGSICVPILALLGYDIRKAVGTASAIGFVIGLPGAIVYALTGWGQEGLPPGSLGYVLVPAALVIIPLSSSFARVGVYLAHSIPRRALRLSFGALLMVTSVKMARDLWLLSSGAL